MVCGCCVFTSPGKALGGFWSCVRGAVEAVMGHLQWGDRRKDGVHDKEGKKRDLFRYIFPPPPWMGLLRCKPEMHNIIHQAEHKPSSGMAVAHQKLQDFLPS